MEPDTVTPADLARELSVSPKSVRAVLRTNFGTLTPPETRWNLTPTQVAAVRSHFQR